MPGVDDVGGRAEPDVHENDDERRAVGARPKLDGERALLLGRGEAQRHRVHAQLRLGVVVGGGRRRRRARDVARAGAQLDEQPEEKAEDDSARKWRARVEPHRVGRVARLGADEIGDVHRRKGDRGDLRDRDQAAPRLRDRHRRQQQLPREAHQAQ